MIITFEHPVPGQEPRYCAISPKYILHESAYSIFSRFALFNVVQARELVRIFANHDNVMQKNPRQSPHLACTHSIDAELAATVLDLPISTIGALFLCPTHVQYDRHISEVLKVCPACLAQGRHYTIFQYGLVHQCPVHGVDLQQCCRHCSASVRYALSDQLFKTPYGCWQCGRQLGSPRINSVIRFINTAGQERLDSSYKAFKLTSGNHLHFSIGTTHANYHDNELQLSASLSSCSEWESRFFRGVQKIAVSAAPNKLCVRYAWWNPCRSLGSNSEKFQEVSVDDLVCIAKSIFRNFKKRRVGRFKLSKHMISGMWRPLQRCGVLPDCYPALTLLDWSGFWTGANALSRLIIRESERKGKISEWLSELRNHPALLASSDTASRNWLLSKIFSNEVCTTLNRQLEEASKHRSEDTDGSILEYVRKIAPVFWATYLHQHQNHTRIFFIAKT
ncbi:hypothetical protein PMI35_06604 [Pseudomonas sp. GM78]|uniref:TniQ family protein n=1 Tax=Pseudomonas sp. GM78 TaxID=1144337 RepID=UPI000270AABB|nr:TniQ family protein [Pseudomonas sp. GM78]EJN16856.1 hypothetical protein PMI35_06604 [Pseudomonas sp. GM78]